jgi:hypothetical protein
MNINLTVQSGNAALTVWSFTDGKPYNRAQIRIKNFSKVLTSTQDNISEVVPMGGQVIIARS